MRESGRQLAALRDAINSGDRERFARTNPTVRGMLRSLSATAADRLAAALESLDPQRQKEQACESLEVLTQAMASLKKELSAISTARPRRRAR